MSSLSLSCMSKLSISCRSAELAAYPSYLIASYLHQNKPSQARSRRVRAKVRRQTERKGRTQQTEKLCPVPDTLLTELIDSSAMSRQAVQVQPESRVQEAGQWSTGLCECYKDVGDCCFALCCLPVFTCKVTSAVGACPCLPLLDCIGCVPPASLAMRASVRQRYGIQGSVWSDCLYGCCCYPLSWLQISRELKRRAASHASSSSSSARYTALTSLQGAHLV